MNAWTIEYIKEAVNDIRKLDNSIRPQIKKGIEKVAKNPVAKSEGGYGTPLSNFQGNNLSGLYKIKFRNTGIRVVYGLKKKANTMIIVVVAARADNEVYHLAEKRKKSVKAT
jgi:mRNA interferase RelE/StbE